MLFELSGSFVKIVFATDVDTILLRGESDRPPGRYNRVGQDALYLSRHEQSARTALTRYIKQDDPPRVIIQYKVEPCSLFDLRHPDAAELLTASRGDWLKTYREDGIPESWEVADRIRQLGHHGLIEPSRQTPDAWHVVLFGWNGENEPKVSMYGQPAEISM